MLRIRVTLITAAVTIAFAAATVSTLAQPPGGRGGPGGRGQRGGPPGGGMFGGPGGGMFGGMMGNLLMLASNDAVQKELKLTDRQKAEVKKLSEEQSTRSRTVFERLREQNDAARKQAGQAAQNQVFQEARQAQENANLGAYGQNNNLGGFAGGGFGNSPYGGQEQVDPNQVNQQARMRERFAANAAQNEGWQRMRQAMQQMQQETERDLLRVINKDQVKRLREIQLQAEGPAAVLRDDIVQKLEIGEEQYAQIQEVLQQANQAQRELMSKNFQMFRQMRQNQPGGGRDRGQNPGQRPAPGPGAGAGAGAGAAAGAQAKADPGGQGGGQGGPGRGGRGQRGGPEGQRFNPEAFQKFMERPEIKAQMEESRKAQEQLREREYAMIYKALDSRQRSSFKKMLGKPFDTNQLMQGFFRGFGTQGARPGSGNGQTENTAKADTSKAESTKADTDKSATSKKGTTSRRPSLRERRGLGQQSPSNSPE